MSKFTADGFGIKAEDLIGCVGGSTEEMKDCILDVNSDEEIWDAMRDKQLKFIQRTHNRDDLMKVWDEIIEKNFMNISNARKEGDIHKMEHNLLTTEFPVATKACPEGERHYTLKYPDVKTAIDAGFFKSGFHHYELHGRAEGKSYLCFHDELSIS